MNMYIGQVRDGRLKVVKSLGTLDPKEAQVRCARRRAHGRLRDQWPVTLKW
jgi:hypothetical protein